MSDHKKIAWESWNAKVDILSSIEPVQEIEDQEYEVDQLSQFPIDPGFILEQQRVLYTPIGPYPEESMLKPSDRWDCWIDNTLLVFGCLTLEPFHAGHRHYTNTQFKFFLYVICRFACE